MKCRLIGVAFFFCVCLIGCGEHPSAKAHDALASSSIKMMNEIAENMEDMTRNPNEANIKARQEKLLILANDLEKSSKEIEKLPKSEQNRIDRKFKGDLDKAEARMKKASKPFEGMLKK